MNKFWETVAVAAITFLGIIFVFGVAAGIYPNV
jgi:hypothetical protein